VSLGDAVRVLHTEALSARARRVRGPAVDAEASPSPLPGHGHEGGVHDLLVAARSRAGSPLRWASVWTDGGFHGGEELAGFDPQGRSQGGDVPNPGVDLRGLDALEVPKVNGGPLGQIGLGQLPLQPEPPHVRRDPHEGGVQQVFVHPRALPSAEVPKNGQSAVFR